MDTHSQEISRQAFVWVLRLERGSLNGSDAKKFRAWLCTSEAHVRELLKAHATLCSVDMALHSADAPLWAANESVIERVVDAAEHSPSRHPLSGINWRPALIAAACCAVLIASVMLLIPKSHPTQRLYTTHDGTSWTLSDGTLVQAGPDTELVIDYSDSVRAIRLNHGQAMFDVTPNPNRPLIVTASFATARAVGTRFAVKAEGAEEAVITVQEGVVRVKRLRDGGGDPSATLQAGYEARVSHGSDLSVYLVDLHVALAWTRQPQTFDRQTVQHAVDEFNRHNRMQIVVQDSALAQKTINGTFFLDDPKTFARFLESQGVAASVKDDADPVLLIPYNVSPHRDARESHPRE